MKKFLSLVLVAIMLMASTSALAYELTEPGAFPIVKGDDVPTITLGIQQKALTTDYDNNELTLYLEEKLGVNIEFFLFPTSSTEAKQKLSLMVAGKETLPDIIFLNLNEAEKVSYGSSGVILPLNDYMANSVYYWDIAMNTYCTPEQKAQVLTGAYSSDGNIYGYPQVAQSMYDTSAVSLYINKQWLNNLNLETPKTTDELYEVLKAFKEKDPNGNGIADEIPMIGSNGAWRSDLRLALMNSFLYHAYTKDFKWQWTIEDGKVVAPFVQDAYREGLRYINKLSEEGLLSPVTFSQTQAELTAILSAPNDQDTIVGCFVGVPASLFGAAGAVDRVQEYELIMVSGPEGVCYSPNSGFTGTYNGLITKDCADPDLAFRFMDSIAETDTTLTMRYGKKDVDWHYTNEGTIGQWRLEGFKPIFASTPSEERPNVWGSENNIIWHANILNMLPPKLIDGCVTTYVNENRAYQQDVLGFAATALHLGKHPEQLCPTLIFTAEETEQITEIQAAVQTYVDECFTRFILGDLDIEKDWDSYLGELEAMGLEYYLEICQTAFDRMMSN